MQASNRLGASAFAQAVLRAGEKSGRDLYPPGSVFEIEPSPVRELSEEEFYRIGCGYSLAHLLSLIQQLEHVPVYLTTYQRAASYRSVDINRASDLVYHWENVLIRARGLEDRVLHLVCDVLHLGYDRRHVSFAVVRRNAHVRNRPIAKALDSVHKLLQPLAPERNRIIHERGLADEDLRRIEFWLMVRRLVPAGHGIATGNYLTAIRRTVPERVQRIEALLIDAEAILDDLFRNLEPHYRRIANRLEKECGDP